MTYLEYRTARAAITETKRELRSLRLKGARRKLAFHWGGRIVRGPKTSQPDAKRPEVSENVTDPMDGLL